MTTHTRRTTAVLFGLALAGGFAATTTVESCTLISAPEIDKTPLGFASKASGTFLYTQLDKNRNMSRRHKRRKTLLSVFAHLRHLEANDPTPKGKHELFKAMHSMCQYAVECDVSSTSSSTEDETVTAPNPVRTRKRKRKTKRPTRTATSVSDSGVAGMDLAETSQASVVDPEAFLEHMFVRQAYPVREKLESMARTIKWRVSRVDNWFAARRRDANNDLPVITLTQEQDEYLRAEFAKKTDISPVRAGTIAAALSRMGSNVFSGHVQEWFQNNQGSSSQDDEQSETPERIQLTEEQDQALQVAFMQNKRPSDAEIAELSTQVGIPCANIKQYFKRNRRRITQLGTDPTFRR